MSVYEGLELKRNLEDILSKANLGEKEMWVIRKRFGLDDGQFMDLESVAKAFPGLPITRERVRQMEAKALKKIREANTMDLSVYDWLLEIKPYITLLKAVR